MKKATETRHVFSVRALRGRDASILRLHIKCVANALSVYIDRFRHTVIAGTVIFLGRDFLAAKRAGDAVSAGCRDTD